jgi:hypothetical protein
MTNGGLEGVPGAIPDNLRPNEKVIRAISDARRHLGRHAGNEQYVIMARNNYGGESPEPLFVCGFMDDLEAARTMVGRMNGQGSGQRREFSLFTNDGFPVSLED